MDQDRDFQANMGISRRTLLRRGAVIGGLVWTAPVIRSLSHPAFAAEGTPRDLSYVALCYSCDGGATQCCLKWDLDDDGNVVACETGSKFATPDCTFDNSVDDGCGDCNLFTVSSPDGGQTVTVCFINDPATDGCQILDGAAVGKCAQSCVGGSVSGDKRCVTFSMCL